MEKTLGQQIRFLRENEDISLRELSRKLDISAAFLSDIELGRRNPSIKVLKKLAIELNTSLEDLQKYDSRPPIEELKRLASKDPTYGLAFRKIVENDISPQDILDWAKEKSKNDNS